MNKTIKEFQEKVANNGDIFMTITSDTFVAAFHVTESTIEISEDNTVFISYVTGDVNEGLNIKNATIKASECYDDAYVIANKEVSIEIVLV